MPPLKFVMNSPVTVVLKTIASSGFSCPAQILQYNTMNKSKTFRTILA